MPKLEVFISVSLSMGARTILAESYAEGRLSASRDLEEAKRWFTLADELARAACNILEFDMEIVRRGNRSYAERLVNLRASLPPEVRDSWPDPTWLFERDEDED